MDVSSALTPWEEFIRAVRTGNVEKMRDLVKEGKVDPKGGDGVAIVEATRTRQPESLSELIELGLDTNKKTSTFEYALGLALQCLPRTVVSNNHYREYLRIVEILSRHATEVNNHLNYACNLLLEGAVEILLEHPRADVNWRRCGQGQNTVEAAIQGYLRAIGSVLYEREAASLKKIILLLAARGADCDHAFPIHVLVRSEYRRYGLPEEGVRILIPLLIGVGCDINAIDQRGRTALSKAYDCNKNAFAVKLLISLGADPFLGYWNPVPFSPFDWREAAMIPALADARRAWALRQLREENLKLRRLMVGYGRGLPFVERPQNHPSPFGLLLGFSQIANRIAALSVGEERVEWITGLDKSQWEIF